MVIFLNISFCLFFGGNIRLKEKLWRVGGVGVLFRVLRRLLDRERLRRVGRLEGLLGSEGNRRKLGDGVGFFGRIGRIR